MDFTYHFALIFAALAGVSAQIIRVLTHRAWSRKSAFYALGCALALNGLLLLNWAHLLDWGGKFAALDLSIITALTIVGFGATAPGALRAMIRR